jgi:hypothetical protein
MFKSGIAQKATAFSILDSPLDSSAIDSINRLRRRVYAQLSPFKEKKKFLLQGLTIFLVIRILVCRAYFSRVFCISFDWVSERVMFSWLQNFDGWFSEFGWF